ncbi:MAG: type II toxin-antitoxin system HicB family antitoxin [Candidatus Coatesbacteria bacterium]
MILEYVEAAMAKAKYEIIANNPEPYYGEISACRGVWATGRTLEACRDELREVLDGWIALRLRKGLAIPVVGGRTVRPPVRLTVGAKT